MSRNHYEPTWADTVEYGGRWLKDELDKTGCPPDSPAVYTLRLLQPKFESTLKENWEKWNNEKVPSWAWAAYYADSVYYVGATGCMSQRLSDYTDPEYAAKITNAFPIWKVVNIEEHTERSGAMKREPEVADELRERKDDAFVFQA